MDDSAHSRTSDAELSQSPPTSTTTDESLWTCAIFLQAATAGNLFILQQSLSVEVDVNILGDDKCSALHCAARAGHTSVVQYLLNNGADLQATNWKHRSPLHEAILGRNLETVNLLVQSGGHLDVSEITEYCLAQSGSEEILKSCLNHLGESITPDMMYNILSIASKDGHVLTVAALLSLFEKDVNNVDTTDKTLQRAVWETLSRRPDVLGAPEPMRVLRFTPLHLAASKGYLEIVQLLVKHGSDINLPVKFVTPLQLAAREGHEDVVGFFLSLPSIQVNRVGDWGYTPLQRATKHGRVEVAKLLFDHGGTDISISGGWEEMTPLHLAATSGHLEVVKLLLQQPYIDTRCCNCYNQTPLQLSALYGHWEIVQVLLDYEDNDVVDIICLQAVPSRPVVPSDIVKRLLRHSDFQNINLGDKLDRLHQGGLLHMAIRKGDYDVVRCLLGHENIDVNLPTWFSGKSPLSVAAELGQTNAVKLLLEHKNIDVNLHDKLGRTPLQISRKKAFGEVIDLLLAHGAMDHNTTTLSADNDLGTATESNTISVDVEDSAERDLDIRPYTFLDGNVDDASGYVEDGTEAFNGNSTWLDTLLGDDRII
jgi:ankyrin repeat protein